jgi:hypothetical protein
MKIERCAAALALIAIITGATPAFALVHNWSHQYTGVSAQNINALATDAAGNIYAVGSFNNTCDFGGGNRTSLGGSDIVLVKFNAAGVYQWDKTFGDVADLQSASGVGIDAAGNIFMGGVFQGSVNFGGGALTTSGERDIFVAKFNSSGTYLWAKKFGSSVEDEFQCLNVDVTNSVYVACYSLGTLDFGGGPLTNQGSSDAYLAKLDGNGAHVWSKRFGDAGQQIGRSVTSDHWGNVFFGLNFTGNVDMGGGSVASAGSFDIGIVQYDAAGNYAWSHRYGDASQQQVNAMAAEEFEGYVYFTGGNFGIVDFGGGPITSAGSGDVFLAKLDCSGAHLWSKGYGGLGNESGTAVRVDAFNNVYLAGTFDGTIDFGGGLLTSAGNQDVFLARLTFNGDHVSSARYGDPDKFQIPSSLTSDAAGNVTMSGGFQGTINLGGATFIGNSLDAFIAQYAESPTDVRTPLRHTEALWAAPNPFNPLTVLHFDLAQRGHVRLDIYDVRGARVATLVDRDMHPGAFTSTWRGVDDRGNAVSSGVYYARLSAGVTQTTTKLVLLK